ncbi:MAG: ArsR family transcriptional regulator [Archaeoglobaceae archaeon]|nr:ArsR family transcriptional regulator [Archaeoglobaceae archaeon]MDW7989517.1 ArsR family transcriptional regulator [Archaeoglobaceae archaeon]
MSQEDIYNPNNEGMREILKVISRKGVREILKSLRTNPKKFSQLMFETKLNPSIIDRHLKALIKLGLIIKDEDNYKLTNCGFNVLKILDDLCRTMNL